MRYFRYVLWRLRNKGGDAVMLYRNPLSSWNMFSGMLKTAFCNHPFITLASCSSLPSFLNMRSGGWGIHTCILPARALSIEVRRSIEVAVLRQSRWGAYPVIVRKMLQGRAPTSAPHIHFTKFWDYFERGRQGRDSVETPRIIWTIVGPLWSLPFRCHFENGKTTGGSTISHSESTAGA